MCIQLLSILFFIFFLILFTPGVLLPRVVILRSVCQAGIKAGGVLILPNEVFLKNNGRDPSLLYLCSSVQFVRDAAISVACAVCM